MEWIYEENRIYAVDYNGDLVCEASYIFINDTTVDINHTYVRSDLRGQGVAGDMMKTVLEYFRKHKLKTTAMCSYAHSWLIKHQDEYADVISDNLSDQNPACKIF